MTSIRADSMHDFVLRLTISTQAQQEKANPMPKASI